MKTIFIANTNNKKIVEMLKRLKGNCIDYSDMPDNLNYKELLGIRNFSINTVWKMKKTGAAKNMEFVIFNHLVNFLRIMISAEKEFQKTGCKEVSVFNKANISGLAIGAAAEKMGIEVKGMISRKPSNEIETNELTGVVRGRGWIFLPGTLSVKCAMPLLRTIPKTSVLLLNKKDKNFLTGHGIKGKIIKIKTEKSSDFQKEISKLLQMMKKEEVSYKKNNFWNYFMKNMENELRRQEYANFAGGINKFIENESPSYLVLYDDIMFHARTAAIACKKAGIPTVLVQHGATVKKDLLTKFTIGNFVSDKLCVWSDDIKKWIEKHRTPAGKIIVTGNPLYDSYKKKNNNEKYDMVFATRPFLEEDSSMSRNEYIKFLENIKEKTKEKKIIVKPHPRDDKNLYKSMGFEVTDKNIEECMEMSKTMMTFTSTVIFEALLQGKNVICLNKLVDKAHATILDNKKFIHMPATIEELDVNFINKTDEKDIEKFLETHLFKLDGKSSERIKNVIEKCAHVNC